VKNLVAFVFLNLFSMLGCGTSGSESAYPRAGTPTAEEQQCSRDRECVLVDECCECALGGTRAAVRADAVQSLEAAADERCASRTCAADEERGPHRSCSATGAVCRGGRCIPQL
jgi:hypothetical protein